MIRKFIYAVSGLIFLIDSVSLTLYILLMFFGMHGDATILQNGFLEIIISGGICYATKR